MATYGYGRVSRDSQSSENQKQLIEKQLKFSLDMWYEDHATSGSIKAADRKNFAKLLQDVKEGDTIVFSRVDRISRKTSDVLNTVEGLLERGVEVYILQIGKEPLSGAMGKVILGVFAIFAENERLSIVERTQNGLAVARSKGTIFGAKLKIAPEVLEDIRAERSKGVTLDSLSAKYKLDRNTISQNVKKWGDNLPEYKNQWNKREAQYITNAPKRLQKSTKKEVEWL